ncbi:unnamed protein product [Caenorhabditis auriculariae]|uniref:[histone H4]-lysine(20) N-methyltransferase n=1 Tax=Caenorhabditis auriculariae TaxID=2777116 RepID=A0A8S1H3L3_9PELO|nr:unnamed protein product [Caenorhabditis auriculariae]
MMRVAAQKRNGRTKKKRSSVVSMQSLSVVDITNENGHTENAVSPPRSKIPSKKGRQAVKDVSNHKITEFFPVRRSSRKTSKQIEEEERDALRDAVLTGGNEKFLDVYKDPLKGRGIRAGRNFEKGDFVVEYKGEMLEYSAAKTLEEKYANDSSIGSYMYFFTYNNKKWCIDATKESPYKGRLINHSMLRPNLRTKVVEFDGKHHLILVAKRNIEIDEELLYDYGDRTAATIAKNPWLINT